MNTYKISRYFFVIIFIFTSIQLYAQPLQVNRAKDYLQYDLEDALAILSNEIAESPESPKILLKAARFMQMMGFNTEASQHLEQANRLNPYAADLYGFNGLNNRLNVLYSVPEKYLQTLNTVQRMNYYYNSMEYLKIEEEKNNAIHDILNESIEYIEKNELDSAFNLLNSVLLIEPESPIALDLKGVILTRQNQYEKAIDILNKVVESEPDFAIAWYNLSIALKGKGEYQKAKKCLDKAIELRSDLTKAYFERALISKALDDKVSAIEDYNKIIDMRGEQYMEAYLNRGLTLKLLGDYEGALSDLNKVVANAPENAEAYKNRANLYLLFGKYEQAIKDFSTAITLNRDLAEAYHNRAVAYFIVNKDDKACSDLEKSNEMGFELAGEKMAFFCDSMFE